MFASLQALKSARHEIHVLAVFLSGSSRTFFSHLLLAPSSRTFFSHLLLAPCMKNGIENIFVFGLSCARHDGGRILPTFDFLVL